MRKPNQIEPFRWIHRFRSLQLAVVFVAIPPAIKGWSQNPLPTAEPANQSAQGDSPSARSAEATIAGRTIQAYQSDLGSDNRVVRLRAVHSLGAFESGAAQELAGKTLIEALDHSDPAVRYIAANHLGRIGGETLKAASAKLKAIADSADQEKESQSKQPLSVRLAACFALSAAGESEKYLPTLIRAVEYPERGMACAAADLLAQLGSKAIAAVPKLEEVYKKNKPGVPRGDYHIGGATNNALRKIRGM